MDRTKLSRRFAGLLALPLVLGLGCGVEDSSSQDSIPSFDEFEAQTYQEPWEGGVYIVSGDIPVENKEKLWEFYDQIYNQRAIVNRVYGLLTDKWNALDANNLTYCVSTAFGARYNQMVAEMNAATAEWERHGNFNFIHDASQDSNCTALNIFVKFDVRPVSGQRYLARAFFPSSGRSASNVLIDSSSFGLTGNIKLRGVLRHELGHTLGLRHEHTRPEAGSCYEDNNWAALTVYDKNSVMHYPQCNGNAATSLAISGYDAAGIRALYP